MILTPAQATIARDTHRFRVLRCGRRFGKTILMTEEIKGVALSRPSKIAYIATTIQQARDIVWTSLLKELQGAIIKTNEARLEITVQTQTGEESQISLRGWENIETLRGLSFDFLGLDEIAKMRNFWVLWNEVLRPTLLDRKGQAMFASTPKGYNHFYDLCNRELIDSDYRAFHYTTWDNPWIPREEIEAAKATMTPESFAQEHEAIFQKMEGLVYKEFNRRLHTYEELPDGDFEMLGGVDFGYRNPAAVLTVYSDGKRFYIEDEWYKRERTDAQVAEYIAGNRFVSVFPDPENPGGIEELRRRGVNTREVVKGRGSVEKGIQQVRELILNNRLKVNKRCINLISEFEMYSYDEDKGDRNEKEEPVKMNDHCLVGSTMIAMENGQKRLDEIKVGDIVKSEKGNNRVLLSRLTRKKAEIYEIELSNGFKLRGTGDHKIYTNRGKIALDSLRYDDNIKVLVEKNIKLISPQEQDFVVRLVRRERCGQEDVYNLTVENEHNYYANGILVKNCLDALRYIVMTYQPKGFLGKEQKTILDRRRNEQKSTR